MKKKRLITLLLVVILVSCSLISCENSSRKQREIINTFSSFDNSDEYILITAYEIHIGNKIIDRKTLCYNDAPMQVIISDAKGVYAYCEDAESDLVNIVYMEYETNEITLIDTVSVPSPIIAAEYYDEGLYFRTDDPQKEDFGQIYFVYDLTTGQTSRVDTDALPYDIEKSGDHNRSPLYMMQTDLGSAQNRLKITHRESGESKIADNSLLETCAEGKKILELGKENMGAGCSEAFEKDGEIYLAYFYITDGFLGSPCHIFIMKYDFESHTLSYHTSICFPQYPETIVDLYIP
ncbi:MAG: hypothetical protein E7616_07280 [Ruminococcaceae bacterium]|nr:hypothetical protein [Oscillospiraceae bacterium]